MMGSVIITIMFSIIIVMFYHCYLEAVQSLIEISQDPEGGMIRLETLVELKCLNSSCLSLSSYRDHPGQHNHDNPEVERHNLCEQCLLVIHE